MEIRAARIQDSYFLPGAQTLPTSPQTARPQPAQQTFFSLFLFRATKPYFTPTNSNSLAQILPLLNQIQAAHRPLDSGPQGQLSLRSGLVCPGHACHSLPPSRRALTDLRQAQLHEAESPDCAPPQFVHGVTADHGSKRVELEGPRALSGGPAEDGARRAARTCQRLGSGWAMRAPRKLAAVFIQK